MHMDSIVFANVESECFSCLCADRGIDSELVSWGRLVV